MDRLWYALALHGFENFLHVLQQLLLRGSLAEHGRHLCTKMTHQQGVYLPWVAGRGYGEG